MGGFLRPGRECFTVPSIWKMRWSSLANIHFVSSLWISDALGIAVSAVSMVDFIASCLVVRASFIGSDCR